MNIAILIPCYNEELTIEKVILDFKKELPEANIYVYDNNSKDKTATISKNAGAQVIKEFRQGKGNVIRSMFRDIDADIYVMIDGDDTYPAEHVNALIKPIINREADMVVGDRHDNGKYANENKRPLHNFGNHLVKNLINALYRSNLKDIMSGYRVFNKKFVKNFPVLSSGFSVETEMTLFALDKKFIIKEIAIDYRDRPEGSFSKLNTFSDGARVLKTILWVFKDYKPLAFFTLLAFILFMMGLLIGIPVIIEFFEIGLVNKIPSAILASGLMIIAIISLFSGFILDTIVKHQQENYELWLTRYGK